MGDEYESNPDKFKIFELDEYLDLMVRIIERLNPQLWLKELPGKCLFHLIPGLAGIKV